MHSSLSSGTLVSTVLPVIFLGLFLTSLGGPGSAAALPQADTSSAATTPPTPAIASATTTHAIYLPLIEKHEWITAPLQNGGFEADWSEESSTACLIFYTDGTVESTTMGNVLTPPGWLTWYKHGRPVEHDPDNGDGWVQPEVRDARHTDPDRMHSGLKGQVLFKTFGIHDGGFMQQVEVTTGQVLRLSGWAHAWSNMGYYSEQPSDPLWSEGSHVGYNHFYALEGSEELDAGDRNFTFWLGIDPLGGTDPYASTVVWGQGAHIYNAYHQVPSVVTAAQAPTVTVFLRARVLWRYQHTDAYWDDILLEGLQ